MNIKEVLKTLIESGEDFSDHGSKRVGTGEDGRWDPIHSGNPFDPKEDCDFCDAWRVARKFLEFNLEEVFFPGETVCIGDVFGIVESVDTIYEVRLTGPDGQRRYGRFAQGYLSAAPAARELWYDRDGDVWETTGVDELTICDRRTLEQLTGKHACVLGAANVREEYGPLIPIPTREG